MTYSITTTCGAIGHKGCDGCVVGGKGRKWGASATNKKAEVLGICYAVQFGGCARLPWKGWVVTDRDVTNRGNLLLSYDNPGN